MKSENGSKPAYPDPMRGAEQSISNQTPEKLGQGLTKREMFAMAAMQGLLSSCDATVQHMEPNAQTIEYLVELSVTAADSLLKHLES
jgi:hypothetical protein